jgi:hypothetical protein
MMTEPLTPGAEEHQELLRRLESLRVLAQGLAEAFDEPTAARGAIEMLASIDRMLELLTRP